MIDSAHELKITCEQLIAIEDDIDRALRELNPDASEIRSANLIVERRLSAEANQQMLEDSENENKKRKFNITGTTKLRWLIDDSAPSFNKVDESAAEKYRRKLMQHYHPDKDTGNVAQFEMVKRAVSTSSMEMLALMVLQIGDTITDEDLDRYCGAAFRKLSTLKAGHCYRILRMHRSGNSTLAKHQLQKLIDDKAELMKIVMLRKYENPKPEITNEEK